MSDDLYCTHAEFEARHPGYREHAEQLAAARRARDLPARREFPCHGTLWVVDREGRIVIVRCDRCEFQVTVPAVAGVSTEGAW